MSASQLGKQYWTVIGELDEVLRPQQIMHEKNIWDHGENDEINTILKDVVKKFEDSCYKAIRKK
jgi:hypothetical protein